MLPQLRRRKNFTIREMADKLGLERSYYGRLEAGTRPMSVSTLKKALDFLDASPAERLACLEDYGSLEGSTT